MWDYLPPQPHQPWQHGGVRRDHQPQHRIPHAHIRYLNPLRAVPPRAAPAAAPALPLEPGGLGRAGECGRAAVFGVCVLLVLLAAEHAGGGGEFQLERGYVCGCGGGQCGVVCVEGEGGV